MLAGTACIYQLQGADPKVIEAKLKRRIHELTYRNNPKLDAAGQVEETQEVPAGDDQRGCTRVESPASMGGNKELAVGQSTRSVEGAQC